MRSEPQWDEFIEWARRFYEWQDFDEEEVDYKLLVAVRLQGVREALDRDEPVWLDLLHRAFQRPMNFLHWKTKAHFEAWCDAHAKEARQALLHLWDRRVATSLSDRVDRFTDDVDRTVIGGAGQGATLASCLLMAMDPNTHPVFATEAYASAYRLIGYPDQPDHGSGAIYQHALDFLDRLLDEARQRGLPLRDRLDAQSVLWSVTQWPVGTPPVNAWPVPDRERLVVYRYEGPSVEAGQGSLPRGSRGDHQAVWMFQFNPDNYDLEKHVQEHGPYDWWEANQNRQLMHVGQRVYFMQSGGANRTALVAAGRIVSEVYPAPEGSNRPYRVDVWYEARLAPPIERHQMREDDILAGYRPYAVGMFSTNFPLPAGVAARTAELVQDRFQPFTVNEHATAFDPASVVDSRTRIVAAVVRRQGQPEFRQRLLAAYGGQCAVTGCDAEDALEAAHVVPYLGPETNHPTNGLLLRADVHNLFDLGLLAVDTSSMTVILAPKIIRTSYGELSGRPLILPSDANLTPSREALNEHRRKAGL